MEADILLWIQEYLRFPALNSLMKAITHLGDRGIFWILMAVLLLLYSERRRVGFSVMAGLLLSFLVNNVFIKNVVRRIRPYEVIDGLESLIGKVGEFSFPSGHTASSFVAATIIACMLPQKRYGIAAIILAALIGFSRMYVGVHYPTDVLFGAASGVLLGMLVARFSKRLTAKGI